MSATKLTSPSGLVQYKFTKADGVNSGWQCQPHWTDTGMTTGIELLLIRSGQGRQGQYERACRRPHRHRPKTWPRHCW